MASVSILLNLTLIWSHTSPLLTDETVNFHKGFKQSHPEKTCFLTWVNQSEVFLAHMNRLTWSARRGFTAYSTRASPVLARVSEKGGEQ